MMKTLYVLVVLGLALFSGCQSYPHKPASHTLSAHIGSGITLTSAYSESPMAELQIAQWSNQQINSLIRQGKIVTSAPVIISAEPYADVNTSTELHGARTTYHGEVTRLPAGQYNLRLVLRNKSERGNIELPLVGYQDLNSTVCISVSSSDSEHKKGDKHFFVFLQTGD